MVLYKVLSSSYKSYFNVWVSEAEEMMCGDLYLVRQGSSEEQKNTAPGKFSVAPNSLQAVWEQHSPSWFPLQQ